MLALSHASPLDAQGQGARPDLDRGQAALVCGLVMVVHAVGAIWLWRLASAPLPEPEPAAIAVMMLNEQAPASPAPDTPVRAQQTPSVPHTPAAPAPVPRSLPVHAPQQLVAPTSTATTAATATPSDVPTPPSATPTTHAQASAQQSIGQGAPNATPPPVAPQAPASPKTLPASAVRYLSPPVLSYPRASRELGESGVVRLRVLVDEQGRPREVEVAKSSNYPRLDQAAVVAMRAARFQPHIEDGQPRMVWVLAPLNFQLDEL